MENDYVIIPTYNEAENIPELVRRIRGACHCTILVVDDSPKRFTAKVAMKLGCVVIHRIAKRGLSSAVLEGIAKSQGDRVVVMDADLQHPPEVLPDLFKALDTHDFVIASRKVLGGRDVGLSSPKRRLISFVANLLAMPLIPKVKDRMSGFFGVRRALVHVNGADPRGFKIMLELLASGDYPCVAEIPYTFVPRQKGVSKLSGKVMREYLKQLVRLYLCKFRILKFALVGTSGSILGLGTLYLLTEFVGLYYLLSYAVAFVLSVTSNYVLNSLWTFKYHAGAVGWTQYAVISAFTLLLNTGLVYVLTDLVGLWYMLSALCGILTAFVFNYILAKRLVWRT